MGMQHRLIHT